MLMITGTRTATLLLAFALTAACTERGPRRALPGDATDIQEHAVDFGGGTDTTYFLRARMPAGSFEPYARKLRMTPHVAGRTYSDDKMWLSFDPDPAAPWWTPTPALSGAWVLQDGRCWTYAKHEADVMYLKAICH
jgi:hypothetical protein